MKFKNNLKESWQDDDFMFELDVDDTEVSKGNTFIEDGQEFTWYERVSDVAHLDFDNWAVWSALNPNSNSFAYFVVDEDTGFIDWGPVDTESEAKEFLQSKIDDYNDDILVDNLNESQYNINEAKEANDIFQLSGNVNIIFYESDKGCPVQEFLDTITDMKLLAKILKDIDKLSNLGRNAREPYSRYEGDGIFELASKQGSNIIRIFYFFNYGNQIIMTNGYIKKSQKRDESAFNLAKKYRDDFIERSISK